jgi:phytanoyl-CoA hydroxylase
MLTERQKTDYVENGFIVLESLIDQQDLDNLRAAAARIVDGFDIENQRTVFSTSDNDKGRDRYFIESAQNISCFLEAGALDEHGNLVAPRQKSINKIGHAMHDLDPDFKRFCQLPVLSELVRDVSYQNPVLWQSMYIFKQPGIGGEVRWHQDASYLITEPASVTGLWIAVEDAHKGNGCLWVEPGGHRSPLREIFEVTPGDEFGVLRQLDDTPWPTENEGLAVEVPAGSVIVFSDHLPHYSSHNYSAQSRQAFTMHISEADANWSDRNWLQRGSLEPFHL